MVIKKTVAPPPKGGSSVRKPRIPQKNSQLTIDVSIKDTEVFKDLIGVVMRVLRDERMPQSLRNDAYGWVQELEANAFPEKDYAKELIIVLCENIHHGEVLWDRIKHKYNANSRVRFIGSGSRSLDGLRPDKVVLLKGYEKSKGSKMTWFTHNGEKPEVIDETGDQG